MTAEIGRERAVAIVYFLVGAFGQDQQPRQRIGRRRSARSRRASLLPAGTFGASHPHRRRELLRRDLGVAQRAEAFLKALQLPEPPRDRRTVLAERFQEITQVFHRNARRVDLLAILRPPNRTQIGRQTRDIFLQPRAGGCGQGDRSASGPVAACLQARPQAPRDPGIFRQHLSADRVIGLPVTRLHSVRQPPAAGGLRRREPL
ncbi:MAG: hypothetical protein A2150_06770 [Candidatus Muproteobacteria bacterium RBG_16_64_11]|uniref:Uncharacterized protein n=1 Tax=Candidatus Muproteobacteria bacterium RBG_16_64_11 TaxID=1817758 RepID=A0A1F6T9N5_9PROT|nr:MAG: hypothetical protein A2150_06770 [Candidatus Muproteobacteria bacterium RBG_16_64_11]